MQDGGTCPVLFMKKDPVRELEIKEVEAKIARLQRDIEDLRASSGPKVGYREKLRQLMYWRRRRNRLGGKRAGNTNINTFVEEV